MEGSTQDRRKDTGRRRKRSRAAFKDQHVLLIDQCEEVWTEHAPAGRCGFDSCHSSRFREAGSFLKGREGVSMKCHWGGNMPFIKPKLNLSHLIDVLISPICHQNFANGPFGGGFSLGFSHRKYYPQAPLCFSCFLSVVSINTSVSTDFLPPSVPSLHLCLSFSGSPV